MRLVERQVWSVVASRADGSQRDVAIQRSRKSEPSDAGNHEDGQARHKPPEASLRTRMIPQKPGPAAKTARISSVRNAAADLPLSALLSQVLVAFTIEFDNESERQMQHRTTNQHVEGGARVGPWLVSMA